MAQQAESEGFSASESFLRYVKRETPDVLENANKYLGPTGYFSYVAEQALQVEAEKFIPSVVRDAMQRGEIYVHKLPMSVYLPYCSGHSMNALLTKGLKTSTVNSLPAKHFDTYVDHIANYLITLQQFFTGAQALSSVEWYAGPFIRADQLERKRIAQGVQRLLFNLNYPSRVGMQTPFTNFTVTLDASKKMLDGDEAIFGGKAAGNLGNYEKEAKEFVLALSLLLRNGDAIGQPFTFPIPTLMTTAPMLWNDAEIFESIFETAADKGSFYWLNTRVVDPDASFAMCCRINIDRNELAMAKSFSIEGSSSGGEDRKAFGGIWALPDATGSVNASDVNLPRLVMRAQRDRRDVWELYDEELSKVRVAEEWLRERYVRLFSSYPSFYWAIREYLPEFPANHFNTIGLLGLPEAAAIYMNQPGLWYDGNRKDWLRARDLMKQFVDFAVKRAREWMRETGIPWNVEEIPGESAAPKLALSDLRDFPELLAFLPRETDPIYSTSIAPYYGSLQLSDRVEIEAGVQRSFTGGVMMHIFLGERPDPEALATLTKKLINTDLVYWSYTPALTVCRNCGLSFTGIYTRCPKCGSEKVDIWSRIIGYYRPLKNWNPARRKEFWTRDHYDLGRST